MPPLMLNINRSIDHYFKTGFIQITQRRLVKEMTERSSALHLHFKSSEADPPEKLFIQ